MILVVVIGIWLGIIALKLVSDAVSDYLSERPRPPKGPKKNRFAQFKQGVEKRIETHRNLKQIESGLIMISKREVRVDRPRGAHRRLQVS